MLANKKVTPALALAALTLKASGV